MKTGPEPEVQLILCHDSARGRIAVELNSFVEFDLMITKALRELVNKWPQRRPLSAATGRISPEKKRRPK